MNAGGEEEEEEEELLQTSVLSMQMRETEIPKIRNQKDA